MAKGLYQKCKLLYLMKIFNEQTDENHQLTLAQIQDMLREYDVEADRKTLYDDFEMLSHFGMDIVKEISGGSHKYYLASRDFELAELKLLVDAVQSSKFITNKKSAEMIKKLENLTSIHEASKLQRQVITVGRVKTMNEKVFYNIDAIHEAISANKQITFKYFYIDEKKQRVFKNDGTPYTVSPWTVLWEDENYYLVAFDQAAGKIKHYRVDKMLEVNIEKAKREGKEEFKNQNYAEYAKKYFSMFDGDDIDVKIEFSNSMAGVVIDRFGNDVVFRPGSDDNHFTVTVNVAVSKQFYGWILSLGDGAKILEPASVVKEIKDELHQQMKKYM